MAARREPIPAQSPEQEKLSYFLMLRQLETSSEVLRAAYQRLASAASESTGWDMRTVILDWLESELRLLRTNGEDQSLTATQLMTAAVSLGNALKQ